MGAVKFNVGDLVIINAKDAHGGTFDGELGFVMSRPYSSFSYVTIFNDPEIETLFKNSEISLYNPLDD